MHDVAALPSGGKQSATLLFRLNDPKTLAFVKEGLVSWMIFRKEKKGDKKLKGKYGMSKSERQYIQTSWEVGGK